MLTNPIPILHKSCGYTLSQIMAACKMPHIKRETVRSMTHAHRLPEHMHKRLFLPTMIAWANAVNNKEPQAQQLWACYFPDHEPHIYHIMAFQFYIPTERLVKETGLSASTIRKILRRPKITKRQLRAIYPFARAYCDALYSKKSRDGRDPRYVRIHRALTDHSRLYQPGEIIAD
jgi:hypothetical protein